VTRVKRLAALLAIASTLAAVYAIVTDASGSRSATARSANESSGETTVQGLVAQLPFVGSLSWECDPLRDISRRFTTSLALPEPGATVFASLWADGRQIWTRRKINPSPNPRTTQVMSSPPAARRQTWEITHHHKPATVRVTAKLQFRATPERCLVSPVKIVTRRR